MSINDAVDRALNSVGSGMFKDKEHYKIMSLVYRMFRAMKDPEATEKN